MFRITLISAILIFTRTTLLLAQQPSGSISGTVVDADARQFLPGAHIRILNLDRGEVSNTDGKLTWVHTAERRYHTNFRLHELEDRLGAYAFFRIHRSYLVNLKQIEKLEPWFNRGLRIKLYNGTHLDVARRRLSDLKQHLGIK